MNDLDVENLLRGLPPAAPSSALRTRVEHELDLDAQWLRPALKRRAPQRWLAPMGWGALGAAAAAVVMSVLPQQPGAAPAATVAAAPTPPAIFPVTTIREVVDAKADGIRYNSQSHLPEQHVRLMSVERRAWIDPRDGAEITVETPREQSVVLPVNFQ